MTQQISNYGMPAAVQQQPIAHKRFARILIAALLDLVLVAGIAAVFIAWMADVPPEAEIYSIAAIVWLVSCAMPIVGGILGIRAYLTSNDSTCQAFRIYALVMAILATVAAVGMVLLAILMWSSGFAELDFLSAGALGMSLLISLFAIPPVPVFWISFICAASGAKAVREQMTSGYAPYGQM